MAFESLTEKLQAVFRNLRGKGKLTEEDVKAALKEVKLALLEADVNFKIVKKFIKDVEARAVGEEVMQSLTPAQQVIKIVNEELISLMGGEPATLTLGPADKVTVIMMAGLQGAGKTTTAAKLAGKLKAKGRKVLLAACDVYRPAAVRQLEINGEKVGVEVFSIGDKVSPVEIAKEAYRKASGDRYNVLILDTAGRLHIDEDMMQELIDIKAAVRTDYTLLTVDAMTGQDAVNVASSFSEKVGIDGIIITKLDGDTRGGAALSIRAVTGKPIYFAGMGEKLEDLQEFYPDRMAGRILGMGDVLSLIEKVSESVDLDKQKEMEKRLRNAEFNYDDFLEQMRQMEKMGGLSALMSMMPGMGSINTDALDDSKLKRVEAMILSMTKEERQNPKLMNLQRKQRIAKGSGTDINEVNRVVKQFEQMQKMMKQMGGLMKGKKRGFGGLGGFGGFGGLKGGFPFR
ncbi:MAG TPA: signal recognition particle protein [Candidatus Avilachnospira avistercoris]|nr:signal recognition particle protein [Candidatus Avilachnospira avistercoris]